MDIKELINRLTQHAAETRALYQELAAKDAAHEADPTKPEVTAEERAKLENMIEAGRKMRESIEADKEISAQHDLVTQPAGERRSREGIPAETRQSWGDIVLASDQYQAARAAKAKAMDRVRVPGGVGYVLGRKAIYSGTEATGGAYRIADRDGDVALPRRARSILDLVTVLETESDLVEFARMTTRTNQAAPVAEWEVVEEVGNFGLKPESNLEFELVQAPVKTIATWVAASKQILQDRPQLNGTINGELLYMLDVVLENQMIGGDGLGNNLTGILNTADIQTRTQGDTDDRGGEATDTKADALRRAITDISLAFYQPDGIVLNPGDAEDIELQKTSDGVYVNIYDPVQMRIWRVPVVETPAISAGKGLVGNFRLGATLYDRMQAEVFVGQPDDFFLRNAIAVLAELRAAFAVKRPTAFEEVTFAS